MRSQQCFVFQFCGYFGSTVLNRPFHEGRERAPSGRPMLPGGMCQTVIAEIPYGYGVSLAAPNSSLSTIRQRGEMPVPGFEIQVPKDGSKILIRDGRLQVPDIPILPFIEGDGTGPDIWRASVRVLDAAVARAYG